MRPVPIPKLLACTTYETFSLHTGWRKNGFLPECRSNNLPGWTQGGSDATNILADFAVKYHAEAADLGVNITELYEALRSDGEDTPPEVGILILSSLVSCVLILRALLVEY